MDVPVGTCGPVDCLSVTIITTVSFGKRTIGETWKENFRMAVEGLGGAPGEHGETRTVDPLVGDETTRVIRKATSLADEMTRREATKAGRTDEWDRYVQQRALRRSGGYRPRSKRPPTDLPIGAEDHLSQILGDAAVARVRYEEMGRGRRRRLMQKSPEAVGGMSRREVERALQGWERESEEQCAAALREHEQRVALVDILVDAWPDLSEDERRAALDSTRSRLGPNFWSSDLEELVAQLDPPAA